jgi:DNA mismatch repair protein MutL
MVTRTKDEPSGTLLRLEGGELVRHERHGARPGTVVTVENLFYNTPARLKFLRTEATEGSHIVKLVSAYALAYPELRFTLVDNGRMALQTLGNGKLYDVLVKVLGLKIAQQMLAIQPEEQRPADEGSQADEGVSTAKMQVDGYVSGPSLHRSTRTHQLFFVNRRWISDRSLSYAVEEAYRTLLPVGRHPMSVLSVRLDPADVDVNVHPTKREVRFRDPRGIFSTVQRAVRHAIIGQAPVGTVRVGPAAVVRTEWQRQQFPFGQHDRQRELTPGQMALEIQRTGDAELVAVPGAPMRVRLPMLRVLGQVRQTYIIAEGPDGLYLVDQHAAHERILLEHLQAEQAAVAVSAQTLLEPLTVELLPQQRSLLEPMLEQLAAFGFEIAPFGGNTFLVRAIPAALRAEEVAGVIGDLLEAASEGMSAAPSSEQTLYTIVCHSAVRAGQTLTLDEARELIQQLEATSAPYTCPHGRPTMIHLSSAQLEKSFGRR